MIPDGRELSADVREGRLISQMPVENVEFVLGHQVEILLEDLHGQEMSRRIHHQPTVGKSREIHQ